LRQDIPHCLLLFLIERAVYRINPFSGELHDRINQSMGDNTEEREGEFGIHSHLMGGKKRKKAKKKCKW